MNILIFLGSVRQSSPPRPARLGERVAKACLTTLHEAYPEHEFELIDPLDYDQGAVFKPHFAYSKSKVPQDLEALAQKIQQGDGERWQGYFGRTFSQLLWWAEATSEQRHKRDPFVQSAAFQQDPSQRNAPK